MSEENDTEGKSCPFPCALRHLQCAKPPVRLANKPYVWVLGGPGAGKGTQCDKIVAKYGFVHLSTGDLLRDEVKRKSKRARELRIMMKRGQLVPNEIVLDLLREAIEASFTTATGYLIDGYPREKSQGMQFERTIGPVTVILFFDASCETLTKRLMGHSLTSERFDDNEDTIKLRIQTFLNHNQQVLDQYPSKLRTINAERSIEEIFTDVKKILDPIVAHHRAPIMVT